MYPPRCICRCAFAGLFVIAVFARLAVRAWDLSVVTRAQVQFLMRLNHYSDTSNSTMKDNYVVENSAAHQLKNMIAIAYDPVGQNMYVSDSDAKAGSIFCIRTTGDDAYSTIEPVVAKQTTTVQGMAFDEETSKLYWTTGNGRTINYLHVPANNTKILPQTGHVLISFEQEIPQGIAIDSCRGFLYWTNTYHLNATVERSRLDGTDRRVIVNENLFMPLAVAVDVEQNLVYWSNDQGMYYSIECSDPDGRNRRTVNHGTHHMPFSIALDERRVYWSDWTSNAVWSWPKSGEPTLDGRASLVAKYETITAPMGLVTRSGTSSLVNETMCAVDRAKDVAAAKTEPPAMVVPYEALRNICKNGGVLHATNGTCECAAGYTGGNCEASVCDGYCVTGTCTVDERTGRPRCRCPESSAIHGDRCDMELCPTRCQNGGVCVLDGGAAGNPRCRCQAGFSGDACQFDSSLLAELCPVYCENTVPESRHSAVCRCEGSNNRQMESFHSDMPSCLLNKTMIGVFFVLLLLVAFLGIITMVLTRKVRLLGRRPRIKKRIVVNKSITPLTSCRPPQQQNQQCEITIENCCNMNICETPCFEQDFRPQKLGGLIPSMGKSKKEDKANLLSNTDMTSSEDEKPVY